jgi:hypothetical protein
MWRWVWLFACGCLPDGYSTEPPPPRECDVLVQAIPGGTVIYQDGDGPWQLAPRVGERYGFDVADDRYAVALVDVARRRVDSLYTTVTAHPDVEWHLPAPPPTITHVFSGTAAGMEGRGGRVAGFEHTEVLSSSPEPVRSFTVPLAEKAQTIVFARNGFLTDAAERLIVQRDVTIGADRVDDVDFDRDGVATQNLPIGRSGVKLDACSLVSIFHFDETQIILSGLASDVTTPTADTWRGGDRLELRMSCADSATSGRTVTRFAETPDEIPRSITAPYPAGTASLTLQEGRFRFEWAPPFEPVSSYSATVGVCSDCGPRWTAKITGEWIFDQLTLVDVLSPPDLHELGLDDPALEPASGTSWSLAMSGGDDLAEFETIRFGTLEAPP